MVLDGSLDRGRAPATPPARLRGRVGPRVTTTVGVGHGPSEVAPARDGATRGHLKSPRTDEEKFRSVGVQGDPNSTRDFRPHFSRPTRVGCGSLPGFSFLIPWSSSPPTGRSRTPESPDSRGSSPEPQERPPSPTVPADTPLPGQIHHRPVPRSSVPAAPAPGRRFDPQSTGEPRLRAQRVVSR